MGKKKKNSVRLSLPAAANQVQSKGNSPITTSNSFQALSRRIGSSKSATDDVKSAADRSTEASSNENPAAAAAVSAEIATTQSKGKMVFHNEESDSDYISDSDFSENVCDKELCIKDIEDGFLLAPINLENAEVSNAHQVFVQLPEKETIAKQHKGAANLMAYEGNKSSADQKYAKNASNEVTTAAKAAAPAITAAAAPIQFGEFKDVVNCSKASTSDYVMSSNSARNECEDSFYIPNNGDGFPPLSINKNQVKKKYAHQVFVKKPQRKQNAKDSTSVSATLGTNDTSTENYQSHTGKAWTSHFTNNRSPNEGIQLNFDANAVGNCKFEANELPTANEVWGPTLIGYIAGRFPGRQAIDDCCKSWGVQYEFSIHSSGWLIFRFKRECELNSVLEKGPFFIFQRPLILKTLPPFFEFDNKEITHVPIWVRLPCLPPECWNACGLGRILSNVGVPIRTDALTAKHERVSFARALVEINIAKEVTKQVPVTLPNGKVYMQRVEYEFVPNFCHKCNAIGHDDANCRLQAKKRPIKQTNSVPLAREKAKADEDQPKLQPTAAKNTHIRFGTPEIASSSIAHTAGSLPQQQHHNASSLPQQQKASNNEPQQQQTLDRGSRPSQQQPAHSPIQQPTRSTQQQQPAAAAISKQQQQTSATSSSNKQNQQAQHNMDAGASTIQHSPMPFERGIITNKGSEGKKGPTIASTSTKVTYAINSLGTCQQIKTFRALFSEADDAYDESEEEDAQSE